MTQHPTRERSWPLAAILTVSFGSLTLAATGFVLVLAFTSGNRTARELTADHATQIVSTVSRRVRNHLAAARDHAEFMGSHVVAKGLLMPGREEALADALAGSLAAAPQIAATAVISPDLHASEVVRTPKGLDARTRSIDSGEDAQAAIWAIRNADAGFWGDPVYLKSIDQAVVNYRVPIRIGGKFLGGLITTIGTQDLDRFVTEVARPHDAGAFVLVGPDEVLAFSGTDQRNLPRSVDHPLPPLSSVPDPVIRDLWDETRSAPLDIDGGVPGFHMRMVRASDGHDYVAVYEYLEGLGPIPWVVGCYFRTEKIAAAFERVRTGLIAGLAMLALALAGVFMIGRQLARPILALADATARVGRDGPSHAPDLPHSRLREISLATHGFNDMVHGLRDREKLRETFGKYVPVEVADAIVQHGGTLEPQSRITTTLFTDIAGFSTVAEHMSPGDLIEMLNDYFAALVDAVEGQGGVIHQFQGDAILATFNLPAPLEDHAARAVQAALDIQTITRTARFGGQRLPTRVGINTGPAVCGTVGGAGRLGFTVHGDEVNLAARIEQLNKSHGTLILISESTVEHCAGSFEFERVGEVPVRGREQQVVLYRVLGAHNAAESFESAAPS